MISVKFDDKAFMRKMNNLVAYANGYVDGAVMAKPELLKIIGDRVSKSLGDYIDTMARVNPSMLHHVYEWAETGSSNARLFDLDYTVGGLGGLVFTATLTQSQSVKEGSTTPFYDKARVMEYGIPVKISPKNASALSFNDNGEQVFTKKPVVVSKPGGEAVEGQLENTFDEFFSVYLSQAILDVSGLSELKKATDFKKNIKRGVSGGRSIGLATGRKWITGGKQ